MVEAADPSPATGSQRARTPPRRYSLLGTAVDAMDLGCFLAELSEAVGARRPLVVLNHNLHSLALFQRDPDFAASFEEADLIYIDGAPVIGLARLAGHPVRFVHRLAVLDWFWPLIHHARREGWRIVHVGSREPVLSAARSRIDREAPGADMVMFPGYFDQRPDSEGTIDMVERIADSRPDIVLLGMGMPLQEKWLAAVKDRLPDCPVITVGGIIGFIGGERPTPPRWTGRLGVEWLYRLVTEPRRLWYRYLVEPWVLVPALARQVAARWRG